MMLKSMREASLGSGLGDSQETQTYQDMYDQQLALQHRPRQGPGAGRHAGAAADARERRARRGARVRRPSAPPAPEQRGPSAGTQRQRHDLERAARRVRAHAAAAGATAPAASLGVAPDTLIAQAALETGWGRRMPADADGHSSCQPVRHQGRRGLARASPSRRPPPKYAQGTREQHAGRRFAVTVTPRRASAIMSRCCATVRGMPSALGAGSDVQAFASGAAARRLRHRSGLCQQAGRDRGDAAPAACGGAQVVSRAADNDRRSVGVQRAEAGVMRESSWATC